MPKLTFKSTSRNSHSDESVLKNFAQFSEKIPVPKAFLINSCLAKYVSIVDFIKGKILDQRQFLVSESPFKIMKSFFYFI